MRKKKNEIKIRELFANDNNTTNSNTINSNRF